jgi:hypothetical protein
MMSAVSYGMSGSEGLPYRSNCAEVTGPQVGRETLPPGMHEALAFEARAKAGTSIQLAVRSVYSLTAHPDAG